MKKFFTIVLCMAVVFSLAGCNMKPEGEKPGTPQLSLKQAGVNKAVAEINENSQKAIVSDDVTDFLGTLNTSLSTIAEAVKPSVVNIATKKTISMKEHPFGDFFNDPLFKKFFRDGFGDFGEKRKFKTPALGSGVIVTNDGYILTNNHVVQDVEEIKVTLHDTRELNGKIIGTDPKSDLAIIKVEAENLPAIHMGSSERLKVGELVIAIGNPFGLGHTITMGIVSAIGRSNVGIAEYEDFIQTDAAINPGNSGGALVNIRGELVGINTAIFSTSGGYMGVGFAIPSDMANSIMQSIITHGKVVRGWLGVTIQTVTPELAGHFDIKEEKGVLITDVLKDTPAEKAGLRRGDVIIEFDGKPVEDSTELRNEVAGTLPESEASVKVIREGKETLITVIIGEQPDTMAGVKGIFENVLSGVHVQDISADIQQKFKLPDDATGVFVTNIEEDSPAATELKRHDIIEEVNRKTIRNVKDYKDAVSEIGSEDSVLLLVHRSGGYVYVTISPEQ